MYHEDSYHRKDNGTLVPDILLSLNQDEEVLVGIGITLHVVTSDDELRLKMGVELVMKEEDPDTFYVLIGVL